MDVGPNIEAKHVWSVTPDVFHLPRATASLKVFLRTHAHLLQTGGREAQQAGRHAGGRRRTHNQVAELEIVGAARVDRLEYLLESVARPILRVHFSAEAQELPHLLARPQRLDELDAADLIITSVG